MFNQFLYELRAQGMEVSTTEWLTLMEGLQKGLHGATVSGFYNLCRAVLCKSESDYDSFQQAFTTYFQDGIVYGDQALRDQISDQIMEWVNDPGRHGGRILRKNADDITEEMKNLTREQIEEKFRRRLSRQQKEHNGGIHYVGTHGISPFGNAGFNPNAIRVGGTTMSKSALRVAGPRNFKDFREDNVLSIRQFQMAFRRLCQYTNQDDAEQEFDIEQTVNATCSKGGLLQIRYRKPRRNNIKVLLLMDSGGSMDPYRQLCSRLFQAVSRSNHFKDLKVYYFHNCLDEFLYTNPTLEEPYEKYTLDVLKQCDKDYRVILVGDATMDMGDLTYHPPQPTYKNRGYCGQDWLNYLNRRYRHVVWLNPYTKPRDNFFGDWGKTYDIIADLFPMYQLTLSGLEQAKKKLMVRS